MPISDEQREEFHRRYEEALRELIASRPANWDELSREEKNGFYGIREMTEEEIAELFGTATTRITFYGPFRPLTEDEAQAETAAEAEPAAEGAATRS